MKNFTDPKTGVQTSLQGFTIQNQNEDWTVLQNDSGDLLSFRFSFHFFYEQQQITDYMQNHLQQISDSNDLAGNEGIQYPDEDSVMFIYYQFIDNVSHMVVMAAKIIEGRPGLFYMGITKSESMTGACSQLFLDAKTIDIAESGKKDTTSEKKLSNRILRYMHGYTSNTTGGGGSGIDKSFSLFEDHSFRYSYASVMSMGSFGGSTSQDEGFGTWQVQKDSGSPYLILYWHLGGRVVYRLEWGDPGIIFLNGERYLLENIKT
ncbi:MAG: hypothetical protein HOP10_04740 [Chitinophagaceae bacterium]|nr:hypothetical protein [Chitinophagaceae bacterium]